MRHDSAYISSPIHMDLIFISKYDSLYLDRSLSNFGGKMRTTSDVYILINVQQDTADNVAAELKQHGFEVRITGCQGSPCDIIIFFDSKHRKIGDLQSEIKAIAGVTNVLVLPALPV